MNLSEGKERRQGIEETKGIKVGKVEGRSHDHDHDEPEPVVSVAFHDHAELLQVFEGH
jgi:hypothetical protein